MAPSSRRAVKISKKAVSIFVVVAILAWMATTMLPPNITNMKRMGEYGSLSMGSGDVGLSIGRPESVGESSSSLIMPPDYPNNNRQAPIGDTREFLKTNYSSSIRTREVQDIVNSAKNIVKGNDGRIDAISSSVKSGHLSFVVPKSKFETFREEIEKLTHKKLFSETSSSQNLIGEKRSIEERTVEIETSLENLKQQQEKLFSTHTQSLATINRELSSIRSELSALRKTIDETQDANILSTLRSQESVLINRESVQRQRLTTENNNYANQNNNLDKQIAAQNAALSAVTNKDEAFMQNIETVNGYINVSWISYWDMAKAFSPIHPTIVVVLLAMILWNILARLGYVPKFVLE